MARSSWFLLYVCVCSLPTYAENCTTSSDCTGFKSDCSDTGVCKCDEGFTKLRSHPQECKQDNCSITSCLLCDDVIAGLCNKCVYFLSHDRKQCLIECPGGRSKFQQPPVLSPVCSGKEDIVQEIVENGLSTEVVIGVIAGVSGALLLCVVILIAYCIHIRRTRRNVNLNETHYVAGHMQEGNVKKVPMYDNRGFDTENEPSLVHNLIDRDVYIRELERLRPHAQTLLTMLNEIRHKLRAMDKSDPRVSTYKGVIHQLCRVLVLVHRKDPGASIPSDSLGLMEWAHQMIEDKQMDVEPAEESIETNPVHKISYIEVPPSANSNPYATPVIKKPNPYATLHKRNSQLNASNLSNGSFYSSVPVPVDYDGGKLPAGNTNNHLSVSQNNTIKSTTKESLKRQYEIPWDIKKYSDSFSTLNCSGSDLTMGYFANGRFYDPSPRQPCVNPNPAPEIYAPASSYSDPSNPPIFSTFTGGVPRKQSSASSHSSTLTNTEQNQYDNHGVFRTRGGTPINNTFNAAVGAIDDYEYDDEDSDEDIHPDGLPFDITDATEPVEV
ncbi:uncharacterized protein LOC128210424 [Mya arenaria]|uniref:uncharacterized protein LOC128210424 n=1 Tax=Mya arenaria TaxID=6604 RepID=UPI0022DFCC3D|nr:uncharacterized protein LOC128210424 [Mya arenaria]